MLPVCSWLERTLTATCWIEVANSVMAEAVSSESRRWISENCAISAVARFISAAVTLSSVDWAATWVEVS